MARRADDTPPRQNYESGLACAPDQPRAQVDVQSNIRTYPVPGLDLSGLRVYQDLTTKIWTCATLNEVAKLVPAELKKNA